MKEKNSALSKELEAVKEKSTKATEGKQYIDLLIIAAQKLKEMATERLTKAQDMIKQIRSEVLIR